MSLEPLASGSDLGLSRGDAAVCIPVRGRLDAFALCLRSVLANTPADVLVLVADDSSPDPAIGRFLAELDSQDALARRVVHLRQERNVGFARNVNDASAALAPADVVLLHADCAVPAGWFEAMRRAATSDTRVGTVSALSNSGAIVSVPERNVGTPSLPQDWTLERAAEQLRVASQRLYPDLPSGAGHCLYLRRAALDLVGGFDEGLAAGHGEVTDFCQRLALHGLSNVLADDVLVAHHGTIRLTEDEIVRSRYAYYQPWLTEVAGDEAGPLARALGPGRRVFRGLSVTIDGRCLTRFVAGTQVHTLELIAALDALGSVQLRVLVPPDLGDYAAGLLARMPRVTTIAADAAGPDSPKTEIAHRPYQVSSWGDLDHMRNLGRRMVITHQDLIGYLNPGYHESYEVWADHRRLTGAALAAADGVVFFSRHAAREAQRAGLVEEGRFDVVELGTDHRLTELAPTPEAPAGSERIGERPFLLCLGTDLLHKNRLFAIRLLEALHAGDAWDGALVLAGGHQPYGGSAGEEAAYLLARPKLGEHVIDLPAVTEAEKAWLLARGTAVVYPTTFEGFGLVPFEAADAGLPCLFAPQTSVAELLGTAHALLVPWDAEASAARVAPVLGRGPERERLLAGIREVGSRLTWQRTAERLVEVYVRAADSEQRSSTVLAAENLRLGEEAARLRAGPVDRFGLESAIPPELRRPLLAIAHRRWLRGPIFGTATAIYRGLYLLRHLRRPPAPLD